MNICQKYDTIFHYDLLFSDLTKLPLCAMHKLPMDWNCDRKKEHGIFSNVCWPGFRMFDHGYISFNWRFSLMWQWIFEFSKPVKC